MSQNDTATKGDLNQLEKRLEKKIVEIVNKVVYEAIDKLAVAVAKGFEETATKEELKAVENRLGKRLEKVEEGQEEIKAQMIFRKDDVNNLKADTPSLSQFNNHEKRINKLEHSVFAS